MSHVSQSRRVGFTLIELLIVIAIIGLLISLVLVAANDGVRRAEERATQALITKLETALNDRLDALLNAQPPINQTHRFLASINFQDQSGNMVPVGSSTSNPDDRRAQVIAQFDYIRAELPDVFFVNHLASDGGTVAASYPLNFGAAPYPQGTSVLPDSYVVPLGNNSPGLPFLNNTVALAITPPQLPTTGMFGASFSAAGGIYKNLGYATTGYDGIDNNNNGLIDELLESGTTQLAVQTQLSTHTHKTARSEMLYAILVEGLSPLGSSFSRDDFTSREVQDTDGDGLPEFVDAWGEPLQFYRWPIYYGGMGTSAQPNPVILGTSDSQMGSAGYGGPSQTRQQDPLDPNQLLVSPGWWSSIANPSLALGALTFAPPNGNTTNQSSPGAIAFMSYFHSLVDPNPNAASWDRGGNFTRREYFSKFLILSGGPDREPGVAQLNRDYSDVTGGTSVPNPFPSGTMQLCAWQLIYIENQAAVSDPTARSGSFLEIPDTGSATTIYLQHNANSDDITNHNIAGISTGVR